MMPASASTSNHKMSKSQLSGGTPNSSSFPMEGDASSSSLHGGYFPYRLTATLAALKIVCGCVAVGLGAAAMVEKAGYAGQAAGIWAGVITIISGVLGAYSVRTGAIRLYVIGFLVGSLVSLIGSVIVIIYSASGLAQDAGLAQGYPRAGAPPRVRQVRETAMLINTLLIIVGFLDIVFSLPSVIVCLREAWQCYNPSLLLVPPSSGSQAAPQSYAGKDWLMSWLGQQSPVFYSHGSGVPYAKMTTPAGSSFRPFVGKPAFVHIAPSEQQSHHSMLGSRHSPRDQRHHRSRSRSPGGSRFVHHPSATGGSILLHPNTAPFSPAAFTPLELYTPFYYPAPPSHPSPSSNLSHPTASFAHIVGVHPAAPPPPFGGHPPGSWFYPPPPEWEAAQQRREERRRAREHRKRSRSKSQTKEQTANKRKRRRGLTDSDIERTYTGMDRELAEEFIEQTMDPTVMIDHTMSGTESEAW